MTYDCFTFFNELDLLEIRMNVLDCVVDKFVLVEATKTFTNNDKPLYFNENKQRFKKFEHKIIHVIVDTYPEFKDAWTFDHFQRNSIARGLVGCKDGDVILVSDLDEIPDPMSVLTYKNKKGVKVFKQKMFYYFLNNINITIPYWVNSATRMLSYADFKKNDSSAQKVKFLKGPLIQKGGWHFSYLGGIESIMLKIKSWAHQEYNHAEYADIEKVKERVRRGEDLFYDQNRNKYAGVEIDDSFPQYIIQNQDAYSKLITNVNITRTQRIVLRLNFIKYNIILFLKQIRNKLLNKY
jgi:beta-1,4-mannosyl-glycoprotein beta-1,4-N-acetylglucosaminyltransferase